MRGGQFHNYLVSRAISLLAYFVCTINLERRFRSGSTVTDVDIWAVHPDGVTCAVEVETTLRSAIRNVARLHVIPCDAYVILVPHSQLAKKIGRTLTGHQSGAPDLLGALFF